MANGYSLITVIGLVITLILICNSNNIKEGWHGMPGVIPRVQQLASNGNTTVQLASNSILNNIGKASVMGNKENTFPTITDTQFVSYPSFQAAPAPRFNPGSYGAFINYNLPSESVLGVPMLAVSSNSMHTSMPTDLRKKETPKRVNFKKGVENSGGIKEGFCSSAGVPACNQNSQSQTINKYNNTSGMSSSYDDTDFKGTDMFQSQIVSNFGDGEGGDGGQRIVVNNHLMFVSKRNRTQALGDPIRGDIAVVPCNTGWFQVSANPATMLKQSALAVMGGVGSGGDTQAERNASLIYDVTAGLVTPIGGVDYSRNDSLIANNITGKLAGDNTTIQYTAFA